MFPETQYHCCNSFISAATYNCYLVCSQAKRQSISPNLPLFCKQRNYLLIWNLCSLERRGDWEKENFMWQLGNQCCAVHSHWLWSLVYRIKFSWLFCSAYWFVSPAGLYLSLYTITHSFNLFVCYYKQAASLVTSCSSVTQYESDYASIVFFRSCYNTFTLISQGFWMLWIVLIDQKLGAPQFKPLRVDIWDQNVFNLIYYRCLYKNKINLS